VSDRSVPPDPSVVLTRDEGSLTRLDAVAPDGTVANALLNKPASSRWLAGLDRALADASASGVSSRTRARSFGPIGIMLSRGWNLPRALLRVGVRIRTRKILVSLHVGTRGWALSVHAPRSPGNEPSEGSS
jgi:hypothetical protein